MLHAWGDGRMKTFSLELAFSRQIQTFERVTQFIGADKSGSFGILARHAPLVVVLRYGLARFEVEDENWYYAALPGGVLRFADNRLSLTGVHGFLGQDRDALAQQLADAMAAEDSDIHQARQTLAKIEQSLMRRLAELGKPAGEEVWLS